MTEKQEGVQRTRNAFLSWILLQIKLFTNLISQQICRPISPLSGEDGSLILNLNTVDGLSFFPLKFRQEHCRRI